MSYVLITPVLNEAPYLPQLAKTVLSQSVKPDIWVVVDGGSRDGSLEIAEDILSPYEWSHVIRQKIFHEKGYSHKNIAQAVNEGYEHVKKLARGTGTDFSFIGKTDATPDLQPDYYEALIVEMTEDPMIAVACGTPYLDSGCQERSLGPAISFDSFGFNDIRLYRRDFFEEVGGYPLTYAPDVVLLVEARRRNLRYVVSNRTSYVESRLGGSKIGMWKGFEMKGRTMYALNYHPLLVLMNAAYYSWSYHPHYQALPVLAGYMKSIIAGGEKISNVHVSRYFHDERIVEVLGSIRRRRRHRDRH